MQCIIIPRMHCCCKIMTTCFSGKYNKCSPLSLIELKEILRLKLCGLTELTSSYIIRCFSVSQTTSFSRTENMLRLTSDRSQISSEQLSSPLLSCEADVELAALQVFPGVTHDLVKGVLQQVVPTDAEPEDTYEPVRAGNKQEVQPSADNKSTYFSFPGP